MTVINGHDGKVNVKMYTCAYHRERGEAVCTNSARRPVATVDRTVVDWLMQKVIDQRFVVAAVKELRRRFAKRARKVTTDVPSLEQEASKLRAEIQRLVTAIATGSDQPDLLRGITERRERLSGIEDRVRNARVVPSEIANELDRVEVEARKRLGRFQAFLVEKGEMGRQVVMAALVGPIKVTPLDLPEGRRFKLEGEARVGKLLATEVSNVASPAGVEPALAT